MKRSELVVSVAKKFPSLFRRTFTLSVRGKIPPIHEHWLLRDIASGMFAEEGFPMRHGSYRLHIPRELHSVYLDYFNFLDHEPLTSKVFKGLLKPGSIAVGVGASIGPYTLLAAGAAGPNGRVHPLASCPETPAAL